MNSIKILHTRVDNINYTQTIAKIEDFIKSKKTHQICTVNPEYLMTALHDDELQNILNQSALNVADGGGLLFAAKYTKQKLQYKVTGVDLIKHIAALSHKKGYRIFLLGGQDHVAATTAQILKKQYSHCQIIGVFEGNPIIRPISKKIWLNNYQIKRSLDVAAQSSIHPNNQQIIYNINKTKPDILLVAYGCPKQDKFIARFAQQLRVPVMIGVGGTFDYISGKITRAPQWMRSIHLEWLYRLFREPKRFNRIITATFRFPWAVITKK